jgi:hypothetical protein
MGPKKCAQELRAAAHLNSVFNPFGVSERYPTGIDTWHGFSIGEEKEYLLPFRRLHYAEGRRSPIRLYRAARTIVSGMDSMQHRHTDYGYHSGFR